MYLHIFGGSALIHLLVGYPRLVVLLGIAGIVALANTPHGPGRYAGVGQYLTQVDATIGASSLVDAAVEARARREAANLLERNDSEAIVAAVEETLHRCGAGCTDLSTPVVIDDPELLRRVLVLRELDREAARLRATPRAARPGEIARN